MGIYAGIYLQSTGELWRQCQPQLRPARAGLWKMAWSSQVSPERISPSWPTALRKMRAWEPCLHFLWLGEEGLGAASLRRWRIEGRKVLCGRVRVSAGWRRNREYRGSWEVEVGEGTLSWGVWVLRRGFGRVRSRCGSFEGLAWSEWAFDPDLRREMCSFWLKIVRWNAGRQSNTWSCQWCPIGQFKCKADEVERRGGYHPFIQGSSRGEAGIYVCLVCSWTPMPYIVLTTLKLSRITTICQQLHTSIAIS